MSATLQDRVNKRLQQLGLRETDVAKLAGLNRSFLHDVLRGRSKRPNPEKLSRVVTALKVDLHWLLTGLGNIQGSTPFDDGADEDFIAIPYVEARPSMSGGAVVEEPVETGRDFHFRSAWIRKKLRASPTDLRVLHVEGDSMLPTLEDGDTILLDLSMKRPTPPGIFVLHDGMGLVAKRLEHIPNSDPPKVRILSDNPLYAPMSGTLKKSRLSDGSAGSRGRFDIGARCANLRRTKKTAKNGTTAYDVQPSATPPIRPRIPR